MQKFIFRIIINIITFGRYVFKVEPSLCRFILVKLCTPKLLLSKILNSEHKYVHMKNSYGVGVNTATWHKHSKYGKKLKKI